MAGLGSIKCLLFDVASLGVCKIKVKSFCFGVLFIVFVVILFSFPVSSADLGVPVASGGNGIGSGTTYYVDATGGDDANNGTSSSSAWKTIFKVNNHEFNPGDSVLFKRDEVWREKLTITNSGTSSDPITYGAYGTGAKPTLLGSAERNAESDWVNEGSNIWSTVIHRDGSELLSNPSFDEGTDGWVFSVGGSANASLSRDTGTYASSPASARIDCVNNGQGSEGSYIFFWTDDIDITEGEWYVLSFKAKASTSFDLPSPTLLKSGVGEDYFSLKSRYNMPVGTEWAIYNVFYQANSTASDGQIGLGLGSIPNGATLYMDDFSFRKCSKIPLAADVGALIFNGEESVGVKVNYEEDLDTQGEFWYDPSTGQVKMYSTSNPANYYSDIECTIGTFASGTHGILGAVISIYADHVTVENLDLRYGGSDGIWVEYVEGVTIKGCDISYCGGNYQEMDSKVRKGDGIAFWENAHDCVVEGCKIGEIYDVGLTNQGTHTCSQRNISYRNNIIWNCDCSFAPFARPESSVIQNVRFENNICIGAGFGWSHEQRPNPHGWHLVLWGNEASTDDIYIRNNVFYEATYSAFYYDTSVEEYDGLVLDNNYYYQDSGYLITFNYGKAKAYKMDQFQTYQLYTGQDFNSVTGDKEVVKEAGRELTRDEDIELLNGLFTETDEMEPTKNEGVTLDQKLQPGVGYLMGFLITIMITVIGGIILYKKRSERIIEKKKLVIIGLIGGGITMVGVFLPWMNATASGSTISSTGWDLAKVAMVIYPYIILFGGILSLVGALCALANKVKASVYLLPLGGIIAIGGWAWAATDINWSFVTYGFYACLVGAILALIGRLGSRE